MPGTALLGRGQGRISSKCMEKKTTTEVAHAVE